MKSDKEIGAIKSILGNWRFNAATKYLPVILILAAGIIIGCLSFKSLAYYENNKIQLQLQRSAENRMMALQRGIEASCLVLESMASFHDSTLVMKRPDFKEFVQPLLKSNVAIQALEWIPRVAHSERKVYERAARLDGYAQFSITQRKTQGQMVDAAEREEYFPVFYVEPYKGNEIALGFDLASNPIREQALAMALSSGKMVATARITLVQERGSQFGFLIFLPVYHKKISGLGREERRPRLKGFMLGVFRIGDLVEKAISYLDPKGIDIVIHDLSSPDDERLLYYHPSRLRSTAKAASIWNAREQPAQFSHTAFIDVAGRQWRITCVAIPDFVAANRTFIPMTILLATMLGSAFAAVFLFCSIRSKCRLNQTLVLLQNEMDACRKAEKALCESEERLRQANKMEAIGTLAGGIAHDFNNILSSIIGFTELALDSTQYEKQLKENLKNVLVSGQRAKELVRQILTFSRQNKHELKPIKIMPHVKEALNLIRSSLPTTIEIRQELQSSAIINGDAIQIHQVVMNLCTNAGHAMGNNGGVLEIKLQDVELDADFAAAHTDLRPGHYLKLVVSDSGCGIPAKVLNRIFEPFFTTKGKDKGTGMGLSVVHGIVKSHRGEIVVHSEPGSGTTVTIFLPTVKMAEEAQNAIETKIPKGTESILFVDDEEFIARLANQLLGNLGYAVTMRTSSVEALELFRAKPNHFDLVITDMTMPNMTGDTLARQIKTIRPEIPIILCTGYSANMDQKRAESIGFQGFLVKPILKSEMAWQIRSALERRRN